MNNTPISNNNKVNEVYQKRPKRWIYTLVLSLIVLAVIIASFVSLGQAVGDVGFNTSTIKDFGKGLINPNFAFMFGYGDYDFTSSVVYLMLQTIAIAFVGTIVASILAIPFGFLASKNMLGKYTFIGEFFLILIRTFPEILLAIILVKGFGIGPLTGTLVIGIHSIGMIGKLYAESIENMDNGPIEALDAVGADMMKKIRHGIFPQIMPEFVSTVLYRFDINVRSATILGVVGGGGIGAAITIASTNFHWSDLAAILYAIIITVILIDLLSGWLRKKLI